MNNAAAYTGHKLNENMGSVYFDGALLKISPSDGYLQIGCTRVDVKVIETLYIALKALGHIR